MGASQRRKGHNFERRVVRQLREAMPGADIRRGLQYRDGAECPDVVCPVFHVECKKGRKPNARAALVQAEADCGKGRIPLAVIGDDRQPPFVVLRLADWLDFVREWWSDGQQ